MQRLRSRTATPACKTSLRILIHANADRDEAGGVQAVVGGLVGHLRKQGHRVWSHWNAGCSGAAHAAGETVGAFYIKPPLGRASRRIHLRSLWQVWWLLIRCRPDIVNVHYASPGALYFVYLRRIFGYRLLVSCHGSDLLRPMDHDRADLPVLLRQADGLSVVSRDLFDRIVTDKLATGLLRYIPNGVDTEFWNCENARIFCDGEASGPRIIAIGRLQTVKGFDVLISALAILRKSYPQALLTIVGEGSIRAELSAQIEALGVAAAIELVGQRTRDQIRVLFGDAHIFALSSRSEGMPLALLEAMASGLPCVATDVGGVAETGGGAIRLVPSEDPARLAEEIAKIVRSNDCGRALGSAAREQACMRSVTATMQAYEALMSELYAAAGGRRIAPAR